MASAEARQKLTAVFVTDVAGYSRLMADDHHATVKTLAEYREVFSSSIQRFQGRVVNAPGDSILAEFESVVDAVNSAVEIQRELAERNSELPEHRQMHFRIGVNLGDVLIKDGELFGDGVNIAARLESLADPGGVCISRTVYDQVESRLPLHYDYIGEQAVKNIARPVRAYRVRMESTELEKGSAPAVAKPDPSSGARKPHREPARPSLAVLPFVNMSNDPEQEYFSDGLTEDLITDLSKVSRLSVTARNTVFTYKGRAVNVREVGKELGVDQVLEGSVRKVGNRVRISAQLIDVSSGNHIWAERYDRELEDVFAVQDEITRHIVTALDVELLYGEQANVWRRTTENPDAYYLFLRAREFMRGGYTREGCSQAKRLGERALTLDPQFYRAYVMMAGPNLWEGRLGWSPSPDESFETASALVNKALSVDDQLAIAHLVRGLYHLFTKRHELALKDAKQAASLGPDEADIFAYLALIQTFAGQPAAAVESVRKAQSLSPIVPTAFLIILGEAYYGLAQYEEAISTLVRSLVEAPDSLLARVFLAAAYEALGRRKEAQSVAQQILRIEPDLALNTWAARALPFKNADDLENMVTHLRGAGLPD